VGVLALAGLAVIVIAHAFDEQSPALANSGAGSIDASQGGQSPSRVSNSGASGVALSGSPTPDLTREGSTSALPLTRTWDMSVSDGVLAGQLDQALAGVDGKVSLAVKDLGSGREAVLDGDREQPAASLYKLPVLFTVFDEGLSMGEQLPITEDARSYDTGTMELGVGESLSVSEALERMVTLSDNTSAVMLGSRVGGQRINANLAALGMDTTHYSLERMTTSALDMVHLLDLLARGNAVSPGASADMVHLLLRQRVNDRLPRLLPDDVQVAHKTGNLPGIVNDVGILYGPSTTLAVAALVSDTTDETAAATGIARVALAAYSYFDELPEALNRPLVPQAPTRAIPPVWREPRPVVAVAPTVAVGAGAGGGTDANRQGGEAGSTEGGAASATASAVAAGTPPAGSGTPAAGLAGEGATLGSGSGTPGLTAGTAAPARVSGTATTAAATGSSEAGSSGAGTGSGTSVGGSPTTRPAQSPLNTPAPAAQQPATPRPAAPVATSAPAAFPQGTPTPVPAPARTPTAKPAPPPAQQVAATATPVHH
jgi:beta-lactamase class A